MRTKTTLAIIAVLLLLGGCVFHSMMQTVKQWQKARPESVAP